MSVCCIRRLEGILARVADVGQGLGVCAKPMGILTASDDPFQCQCHMLSDSDLLFIVYVLHVDLSTGYAMAWAVSHCRVHDHLYVLCDD
jgi:hypothetical protein